MKARIFAGIGLLLAVAAPAEEPPPAKPLSSEDVYDLGNALFEQLAPAEAREQLEFPSREQWDGFVARLQSALTSNRLEELADCEPQARTVLAVFQVVPGYGEYVDWLKERLDYIEAAQQAAKNPTLPTPSASTLAIPHYALWLNRLRSRPIPAAAAELMPVVRDIFVVAGLPPELAWLAEVESTFNPAAR